MAVLRVRNFEKFQHYKNRRPLWIKLYNALLDDYEFTALPDVARFHLIGIWLVASRTNNEVPADAEYLARVLHATEPIDLALLVQRGFLVDESGALASNTLADGSGSASKLLAQRREETETETETETEKRKRSANRSTARAQYSAAFESFWSGYPREGRKEKRPAFSEWKRHGCSQITDEIMAALASQIEAKERAEKAGVFCPAFPYAARWLKKHRWEDDVLGFAESDDQRPSYRNRPLSREEYEQRLQQAMRGER